ncbi:MAG: hypothetical protein IKX84_05030, partial [Clostridia bacterium]|nr:hypothetical protein [Clostridia bacterium]
QPYMENVWNMADAIRLGVPLMCSGETAIMQTMAVESMRAFQPEAVPFPDRLVTRGESMNWVEGLASALWRAFETTQLPELGENGLILPGQAKKPQEA